MTNNKPPLVTIITVVFNGKIYIEETIQSVIGQTYKNIEYIVIDGGSNDGTVDIISKYANNITYWISEPDKGIYDAMNKGIKVAKGEWLNFLNAGDSYIDNKVLANVFESDLSDATIIYGDIKVLNENGESYYRKAITLKDKKSILKGMLICHQAIFYGKEIIEFYDATLRIMAEWKHLINLTEHPNFKPLKFEFPFVYYRLGGLSSQQSQWTFLEYKTVFFNEYGRFNYIKHSPFFTYMAFKRFLKRLFHIQNNYLNFIIF